MYEFSRLKSIVSDLRASDRRDWPCKYGDWRWGLPRRRWSLPRKKWVDRCDLRLTTLFSTPAPNCCRNPCRQSVFPICQWTGTASKVCPPWRTEAAGKSASEDVEAAVLRPAHCRNLKNLAVVFAKNLSWRPPWPPRSHGCPASDGNNMEDRQ